MQSPNRICSLSAHLLAYHAFSHFQENLLLAFWKHAQTTRLPASLLHRCNMIILQPGGRPMKETILEIEIY